MENNNIPGYFLLRIRDPDPDFGAITTQGPLRFSEFGQGLKARIEDESLDKVDFYLAEKALV